MKSADRRFGRIARDCQFSYSSKWTDEIGWWWRTHWIICLLQSFQIQMGDVETNCGVFLDIDFGKRSKKFVRSSAIVRTKIAILLKHNDIFCCCSRLFSTAKPQFS